MDQSDQLRKSRQKCHQEAAARRQTSWCVASNVLPQQEIMIQVSIWLSETNNGPSWHLHCHPALREVPNQHEEYLHPWWNPHPRKVKLKKTHWLLLLGASLPTAQHSWLMPDVAPPPGKKKTPQGLVEKKVFGEWKFPGISYQRYQVYDADIDPKVPPWTIEIPHSVRMIRWETLAAARQVDTSIASNP